MSSRKAGVGFIFVTLFLDILGIGLVIPILPGLVKSFAATELSNGGGGLFTMFSSGSTPEELASTWFGLLLASYAAMQFIFSPVLGSLSDQYGRRPVLLASNLGQGLDYLLVAMAPSLGWLFLGRVLSGVTGASVGTATAYIADVTPKEKRSASFALVGIAFSLGFVVGPLLGGVLGHLMLRLPFFVAAALCLLNALWGFFVLPESLAPENRRPFTWGSANPFGTLATLTRYPIVVAMSVTFFLLNLAQRALQATWVLSTAHRYHWNELDAGISLAIVGLGAALVQGGLVRRVVPLVGERRAVVAGMVLGIVNFVGFGLAPTGLWTYCLIPLGSLAGITAPALQSLVSQAV